MTEKATHVTPLNGMHWWQTEDGTFVNDEDDAYLPDLDGPILPLEG